MRDANELEMGRCQLTEHERGMELRRHFAIRLIRHCAANKQSNAVQRVREQ